MKNPEVDINTRKVHELEMEGRGGKEDEYLKILGDDWKKVNGVLHDFVNVVTGQCIELKKQQNQQWLDPSKYTSMSESELDIPMHWVCWKKGNGVDLILESSTRQMMSVMGWDRSYLDDLVKFKSKHNVPTQWKQPIRVRSFKDKFKVIYER